MEIMDSMDNAPSNNAIKKLINKLRKRSIDSRAETDPFHSVDSVANLNPLNQQSISALSLVSAPAINLATYGFNSKSDNSSNKSTSGSNLALPNSVSGQRLITITERSENSSKKNSQTSSPSKKESSKNLPTLPPLNEATSVKQKWNILLSKAKGGVENIPKSFLSSTPEETEPIENADNDTHQKETKQNPTIYKTTSTDAELLSLRSRTLESCNMLSSNLEESGGFFLDLDNLDSELLSAKSGPPDDGLNRNPFHLLKILFSRRNELKNQVEIINGRITKIDSKIADILHHFTSPTSPSYATDINQMKSNSNLLKVNNTQSKTSYLDTSFSFTLNNNFNLLENSFSGQNVNNASSKSSEIFNSKSSEKNQVSDLVNDNVDNNKIKLTIKTNPPNKHLKTQVKTKKSDLAGSNASVINQAVESATAIFNSKNPFSTSFMNASSHSNYNVNLIPIEIDKKQLTSSSSDYSLKDKQFRRFFEKKKDKFMFDQEIEEEHLLDKK